MPEFLYAPNRAFHPDYDTEEHHRSFEIQWDVAGRKALQQPARSIIEVANEVALMHRAWNGPWCIRPDQSVKDKTKPAFIIDEANSLYRCCVCGTAWHILNAQEVAK